MSDVADLKAEVLALRAENAKLRELVWDMWAMRTPQIDFETYTAFLDRMRELGVEV